MTTLTGARGSAIYSQCKAYRYVLERPLSSATHGAVNFLMLNPSTATEDQDDPTIRRCIGYAKAWGFGHLFITNIFALRSTDPRALYVHRDPVGSENIYHIRDVAKRCALVVCAWGNHGAHLNQGQIVRNTLNHRDIHCLGVTGRGEPKHPLYLKKDLRPRVLQ